MKHEYIDKAWVLYVVDHFGAMLSWSKDDVVGEIRRKIAETKPDDVVEVVRCRDCEQYEPSLINPWVGYCNYFATARLENGFCDAGKE